MIKEHFKAIAGIIKDNTFSDRLHIKNINSAILSRRLADYFQQENPRFDREKFLKACGLD